MKPLYDIQSDQILDISFSYLIRDFISAVTLEWSAIISKIETTNRCFLLNSLYFKVYSIVSDNGSQPNLMHLVSHSLLRGILFLNF